MTTIYEFEDGRWIDCDKIFVDEFIPQYEQNLIEEFEDGVDHGMLRYATNLWDVVDPDYDAFVLYQTLENIFKKYIPKEDMNNIKFENIMEDLIAYHADDMQKLQDDIWFHYSY